MRTKPERNTHWSDADRAALARLIVDDYRRFLADPDADAKAFAARHAAGKGALAHYDQLIKTSGGRGEGEADGAADADLGAARAGIASLQEGGEADDDGADNDG